MTKEALSIVLAEQNTVGGAADRLACTKHDASVEQAAHAKRRAAAMSVHGIWKDDPGQSQDARSINARCVPNGASRS
jgi:hypothetical protein